MTYQVSTFDMDGRKTGTLGSFGNVASARQAILDHSNTRKLPDEANSFHVPACRVVEGWFIGNTEYNIEF